MTTETHSSVSQDLETLQLSGAAPSEIAGSTGVDGQTLSGGEAPFLMVLSSDNLYGSLVDDVVVGRFTTVDRDTNPGEFTYELLDDAGGRFKLVGDEIWVADGAAIAPGIQSVTVKATAPDGLSLTKVFAIA